MLKQKPQTRGQADLAIRESFSGVGGWGGAFTPSDVNQDMNSDQRMMWRNELANITAELNGLGQLDYTGHTDYAPNVVRWQARR